MNLTLVISVIAILAVGSVIVALAWWKVADRWADAEHKRFKARETPPPKGRVVIKTPPQK